MTSGTASDADAPSTPTTAPPAAERRRRSSGDGVRAWIPRPLSVGVCIAGLALTGVLTWASSSVNASNQERLLRLQTDQAAATLGSELPSIQNQLLDTDQVMVDTHAEATAFDHFLRDRVGRGRSFVSASVWRLTSSGPQELRSLGAPAALVSSGKANAYFSALRPSTELQVTPILDQAGASRIGFAELPPGKPQNLLVYVELALPPKRQVTVPKSSAFSDLNFALYLGKDEKPKDLLEASLPLPISGQQATSRVPFGNTMLTIVATPTRVLSGSLSRNLAWIVLGVGALLSLASALTVEYVARRRRDAEQLAEENERLYLEERGVTTILQRALLPANVPVLAGLEIAARYLPGVAGIDVGGDWYDVIQTDDRSCVFVVGDVSGRGLKAATTMASIRFAIQAYVAEGHSPATILARLASILDIEAHQQFASVLVGEIDVPNRRLSLVSAGHLPPLLVEGRTARYAETPVGPPIGVPAAAEATPVCLEVGKGTTMLAFTDGLVERRGEHLDVGLERLRRRALEGGRSGERIDEVLDRLVAEILPQGADDDVALLGVRWQN